MMTDAVLVLLILLDIFLAWRLCRTVVRDVRQGWRAVLEWRRELREERD